MRRKDATILEALVRTRTKLGFVVVKAKIIGFKVRMHGKEGRKGWLEIIAMVFEQSRRRSRGWGWGLVWSGKGCLRQGSRGRRREGELVIIAIAFAADENLGVIVVEYSKDTKVEEACFLDLKFDSTQNTLHAQALTLAALAGAAVVEYYDHKYNSEPKVDKYTSQFLAHAQKD
ncbi:hypothetical protein AXF42_Ash000213 [Apostasia shenzhenica]|uniref:Uncharacterized protein n=1 Tax=Apostasia shenzhenica TaxID=1088818 RepID=A0A2I0AFQ2_9ASPA|nr:hypothetical protein AXF42_Ash000213 [Apostasia shenzhenica]